MKKHFDLIWIAFLVLLGPLFIFPKEKWSWVLFLAVSILYIGRWISDRRFLSKTPIDAAIGLLLVMALAGIFVVKDTGEGAAKLTGLVYGIVIFFGFVEILKTPMLVKIAAIIFLAAGTFIAVVGTLGRMNEGKPVFFFLKSILSKLPQINLGLRGAEGGINPNALGGILLLFIPMGLIQASLFIKNKDGYLSRWIKELCLIAILIFLAVQLLVVFHFSSFGTWASLAIALWLMGQWKRKIKAVIVVMLVIIAVGVSKTLIEPDRIENQKIFRIMNESAEVRAHIWNDAMEVVKTHPIFGIGVDQLRRTTKFTYDMSHGHNQFLHTAAELGIPGLIAYLAILIGIFRMAAEVQESSLPEWMRLTSRGLGTGLFAFTLFGMVDAIPLGAKPGIFFWISLAMITSIYLYGRNNGFMTNTEKQA
jgi:putative inorganic carbon (HCO3(-)) transporter